MTRHRSSMRYLPFGVWPAADQAAWNAAIADGDIFDGRGPARHWRPATRRTNVGHYSRWLGFLDNRGALAMPSAPAGRVTAATVSDFVDVLCSAVAPRTMVSAVVGLKVMIKAMAPEHDWGWLADVCNRLNTDARPVKDKGPRQRPTAEIYTAALRALDRLEETKLTRRIERVAYRDSLMLAILAARPLRLRNFASLTLGQSLIRLGDGWLITILGTEVKNGDPVEHLLPASLHPYLARYLEDIRPAFARQGSGSKLWLTYEGAPLADHTIYGRFIIVSKRLLGVAINPHLLRDCAATSLSTESPAAALAAAALLGHRSFATTERYYIRANQLDAGRAVNASLATITASLKDAP
ncbi:MAG: site-specific integrase [Devosia marina]|uniref:site-specific integrase n=1 Tax=Devosia marina TaxID=2683198 RepID=UPI0032F00C7D